MYKSLQQRGQKDNTRYLLENIFVLFGHLIKHIKIIIFIRLCKIFHFFSSPACPWLWGSFRGKA